MYLDVAFEHATIFGLEGAASKVHTKAVQVYHADTSAMCDLLCCHYKMLERLWFSFVAVPT